jgi:tRNA(Ile)-lysidine synthase
MASDVVADALDRCLEGLPAETRLVVAYSGGMDSHVLLHALTGLLAGGGCNRIHAIHVDHGLHPDSARWALHCAHVCAGLRVPLEVVAVEVSAESKEGPEAAARRARYAAFEQRLQPGDALLLAHHLDDQAETFLLQLLRGAGPEGLSAMPAETALGCGRLLRPLLEICRDDIRDYAERHSLEFIDDPGNRELRYDRNYLRQEVMPRIRRRWPAAARTIARAAGHQAALARIGRETGARALNQAADGVTLSCKALSRQPADVARLALRAWLQERGFSPPSKAILDRILDEVASAAADAEPLVVWPGAEVRRYRGALHVMPPLPPAEPERVAVWDGRRPLVLPQGRLRAVAAKGRGLGAALFDENRVEVRFRRGGERCRPSGRTRSATLKTWFQRCGVPPWERDRVPLIYVGGELAAVAGCWVCEGFQCANGEEGLVLEWAPGL